MGFVKKVINIFNPDSRTIKDFTTEAEDRLCALSDQANANDDILDHGFFDYVGRWLERIGYYVSITSDLIILQDTILDRYNYTSRLIHKICQQARSCDSEVSGEIDEYVNQAERICNLVKNLGECINIDSNIEYYKDIPILNRFEIHDYYFQDLKEEFQEYNEFNNQPIQDYEVVNFCENHKNAGAELNNYASDGIVVISLYSNPAIVAGLKKIFENRKPLNAKYNKDTLDFAMKFIDKLLDSKEEELLKMAKEVAPEELESTINVFAFLINFYEIDKKIEGVVKLEFLKYYELCRRMELASAIENVNNGNRGDADLKAVQDAFDSLKQTEICICEVYRDMNNDHPEKQVEQNEKIEVINRQKINGFNIDKYMDT